MGNYIEKVYFWDFGELWKCYLISYFWKLEIMRDIAIIYKILFLDFRKYENVI
jgi:hypothetical protein